MRSFLFGPYTPQLVRRAVGVALFFQWYIVLSGATVRLTGSGLGCPNWPTCTTTRPVPELAEHQMIEFINRMAALPALVTAFVAAWTAWRVAGPKRVDLRVGTLAVIVGILSNAIVGAFVVLLELPPEIVSVHFFLSVFALAAATFAWHAASSPTTVRVAPRFTPRVTAAVMMLANLLVVITAGVLTTASGPHSGASGTGQVVDRFGIYNIAVTWHARGAFVFLALALLLTWLRSQRRVALRDLGVLVAIIAVQITLGEIQYRSGLPWGVVLAHVGAAALMWIVAVRIAADAVFPTAANALDEPSTRAKTRAYDLVS